jgi:hypothetical protein
MYDVTQEPGPTRHRRSRARSVQAGRREGGSAHTDRLSVPPPQTTRKHIHIPHTASTTTGHQDRKPKTNKQLTGNTSRPCSRLRVQCTYTTVTTAHGVSQIPHQTPLALLGEDPSPGTSHSTISITETELHATAHVSADSRAIFLPYSKFPSSDQEGVILCIPWCVPAAVSRLRPQVHMIRHASLAGSCLDE